MKPIEDVRVGDTVQVREEEGHVTTCYCLKITDIEVCELDEEGTIVLFGEGVTEEDEEFAEEFTHRVDAENYDGVVNI